MLKFRNWIFAVIAILMLVAMTPSSDAKLWDLIIIADMEKKSILSEQTPIVSGTIMNHASKPVENAQVHIRTGQESIFTVTDERGHFRVVLENYDRIPGTYVVNIVANAPDGKTGITAIDFQVKGEIKAAAVLEEKLSTHEAKKYLNAQEQDFAKDPIGLMLYKHYQKLLQEYIMEKSSDKRMIDEQVFIEKQRGIADELRQQAIKEYDPAHGTFSGFKYDDYINDLEPGIRETIIDQINFTKSLFESAQIIRDEILSNGGTEEEARQAYLEKITITKNTMENYGEKSIKIDDMDAEENESENKAGVSKEVDIKKEDIEISNYGKTIFVNVNGTTIEIWVNATGVYKITDLEK